MAQFKNVCPGSLVTQLVKDVITVRSDIDEGRLPMYETFVQNLMKTMTTPAEELHHAGTGIAGEGGEILEITKKVWVYGRELDVEKLIKELGDIRFYYQAMLNLLGITDEMVRAWNMQKLRVRYADGQYSDAQANARADVAPLSAAGVKGTAAPEPRKFMGQPKVSEEQAAATLEQAIAQRNQNIHDEFDRVRSESLRQLRKDEQP